MSTPSAQPKALRFLHLEDNLNDAVLIHGLLLDQWPDCEVHQVGTREHFLAALSQVQPDLVLSDFTLPGFNGLAALDLSREANPTVPFVFLSGTIGEDNAVLALQRGAVDYVIKDRPARLVPAIQRALTLRQEQKLRQQAEAKLREQAALLDKARDAICVTDLAGRVAYQNQPAGEFLAALGLQPGGLLLPALFRSSGTGSLVEALRQLHATGSWHGELRLPGAGGKPRHLVSRWTLVPGNPGQPSSILLINTDITAQKEIETQLLRTQRLESIGTLAGGIAHDLNNAFSPILMAAGLLRDGVQGRDQLELIDGIESSARHGSALIKQLLAFARGSGGERVELCVRVLVGDVVALLGETSSRGVSIQTDLPRQLWLVHGDATQLAQVLMNLGINALDAMPAGGRLVFRAQNVHVDDLAARANPGAMPGPHVRITVVDTGSGISPELLDRIFDPFFTTKPAGKGTGLGLATALGIVKGHRGFMQVRSEPDQGTEFTLYLPASPAAVPAKPALPGNRPARGHGECVLVIDDEPGVRQVIRTLLNAYGYQVRTAANGADGVALFQLHRHEIRVVVTDMMMPGMQGTEVIQELRRLEPDVRIVAMSGIAASLQALPPDRGWLALVTKPMEGPDLILAVQAVLPAAPPRSSQ